MKTRVHVPPAARWAVLLAAFVIPALVFGVETALHFTGSAIDGPFQLYNALRRIDAGQRIGVDFQFFHGAGVPYAHYWLYRLFGGRFQDAELAREVVSALVLPASLLIFFRAFERSWARIACVSAALMAALFATRMYALLFALNSMVGLRSTLPTLAAAVMFRAERRGVRIAGVGGLLGLSLFLSTEQGLAAVAAFVVVALLGLARPADLAKRRTIAVEGAATVGVAVVTLLLALTVVGGPRGAAGALRYNFRSVPMDQYWFFGAPPNPFISSWFDLVRKLVGVPVVGLAIAGGIAAAIYYGARIVRRPTPADAPDADPRLARVQTYLAVYGLVACASLLGVFVPAYAGACWRSLALLAGIELLRRWRSTTPIWGGVPRPMAIVALAASALALALSPLWRQQLVLGVPHVLLAHVTDREGFTPLGIWPQTLAVDDSLIAARRARGDTASAIWSTYSGWLEARARTFNPSFDYVIHPLGPENRRAYLASFERSAPTVVQTIRPSYSQYEPWIENANWDLYRRLLTGYTIASHTPWSFLWTPRPQGALATQIVGSGEIAGRLRDIPLPPVPAAAGASVTVLEVELSYETHNSLDWLPIVGSMPRYLVGIEGAATPMPVSLDPYVKVMRFPVFARPGQRPVLHLQTFSLLPGASVRARSIRVSVVPVDLANLPWLVEIGARYGF